MAINNFKKLSIFYLCFTLFFSLIILSHAEIVPLGDISSDKIGETFTVQGRIVNIIQPRSETAPYSIYLTDETETLLVVAWENVMNRIPFRERLEHDARVIITGSLREYRNNLNFYLTDPGNIVLVGENLSPESAPQITPVIPEPALSLPEGVLPPSRIDRSLMGQRVTVQGVTREYLPPRSETAPHSVFLEDGSGAIRIVYWSEVAKTLGSQNLPKQGRILRIRGTVDEFRGEIQIKVNNARDIISVMEDRSPHLVKSGDATPLGSITQTHKGQRVTVTGKIVDLTPSHNLQEPHNATLADGTGVLVILYNQEVAESLTDEQKIEMGNHYEIKGQIIEQTGQIRLKIWDPSNIRALGDASKPAPLTPAAASRDKAANLEITGETPLELPIKFISADYLGLNVTTKGKVIDLTPSWQETAPNTATIAAGDVTINVVYWNDVAEKIPPEKNLEINKIFQITGKIRDFRDELQIKVYHPEDIVPLSEEEASSFEVSHIKQISPPVSARAGDKTESKDPLILPIAELSREHEDKLVIIKGKVTEIKPSWQPSAPNRITLSDDKGEILVVYWADVADRMNDDQKPKKGYEIQVKGKVSVYRQELQVKVYEPADIVILDKNL